MPSLNFKARFAAAVEAGTKRHTIRAWRKAPFTAGDDLSFFSGMRTAGCRRLRPNAPCIGAAPIEVNARMRYVHLGSSSSYYPRQFCGMLFPETVERLAKADGFESVDAFFAFFDEAHGGILCGQLVEWRPTPARPLFVSLRLFNRAQDAELMVGNRRGHHGIMVDEDRDARLYRAWMLAALRQVWAGALKK